MTAAHLLLLKFRWSGDAVSRLTTARAGARAVHDLRVYRAIDSEDAYAYLAAPADVEKLDTRVRAALPGANVSRLLLLRDLAGASASEAALFHYIVETDVLPESEGDFNAWYDDEHLPGLAAVPGTARATRYRNTGGPPRYHACYDLVRPETLGSAQWLAVRGTPWSDRVRPAFRNTKRTMFRRVA